MLDKSKYRIFLICFLLITNVLFTQSKKDNRILDSLEKVISSNPPDSIRLKALYKKQTVLAKSDLELSVKAGWEVMSIARKLKKEKAVAKAANIIGTCYKNQGNFDSALYYQNKALSVFRAANSPVDIANTLNSLGILKKDMTDFSGALSDYLDALKLVTEKDDALLVARINSNIGIVYRNLKNPQKALDFQFIAQRIYEEKRDTSGLSKTTSNIGNLYKDLKDFKKAMDFYKRSLTFSEKLNELPHLATLYNNIASLYAKQNDDLNALPYFEKSLDVYRRIGNVEGVALAFGNLALSYMDLKQLPKAKFYLDSAMFYARKNNSPRNIMSLQQDYAEYFHRLGDDKQAYDYLRKYVKALDSTFSSDLSSKISEMETKFNSEKKQKEIELLKKDNAIHDLENKRQRYVIYGALALAIIFIGFAMFAYRSYIRKKKDNLLLESQNKEIQLQKFVIEEKNKDIIDSIRYAKRLQETILPPEQLVQHVLGEHFVFYKPKDIVSGDFYWVEKLNDDEFLVAAVDCTGHGVPGAIMSIVAHNLLNQTVKEHGITQPGMMLNMMLSGLMEALRIKQDEGTATDGMDLSLCRINRKTRQLDYAGAFNPLYLVRNGELTEIKADKASIGRHAFENNQTFTNHQITLLPGDNIYMFSDGYADQFGGEKGKKFRRKNFSELLVQSSLLPMAEQGKQLSETFYRWKGEFEQVDDILVIGIRV